MKICHLGGLPLLVTPLVEHQRLLGMEVSPPLAAGTGGLFPKTAVLTELCEALHSLVSARPEVLHLHGLSIVEPQLSNSKLARDAQTYLKAFARVGTKIVLSLYGERRSAPLEAALNAFIKERCDYLVLTSALDQDLAKNPKPYCYLGMGLDLSAMSDTKPEATKDLKVLHISYDTSPESSDRISQAVTQLHERGITFRFTSRSPADFKTRAQLEAEIEECDVFIEQIERTNFGVLALLALRAGKTVLSGNSEVHHAAWPEVSLVPIINTTTETLVRKLESVVREPKSLRDLAKRARQYIKNNHDIERIAAKTVEIYKSLKN